MSEPYSPQSMEPTAPHSRSPIPPLRTPWVWYCPDGTHGVGDICDDPVWVLMEWWCLNAYLNYEQGWGLGICTPGDPHSHPDKREFGCHWAVKS